jgi:hypothetical protein
MHYQIWQHHCRLLRALGLLVLLIVPLGAGACNQKPQSATGFVIETIDETGCQNSLALDTAGQPHTSYYDDNDDALKYAWHDGSTWQIETVDSEGQAGIFSSLALDAADQPHISYYGGLYPIFALKYAHHDGSMWRIATVDGTESLGLTSLVVDTADRPHISYCDSTNLKYAYHDGSTWRIKAVDREGGLGFASLALDATDWPHISYATKSGLKYAYYNGFTWQIETVRRGGPIACTSLALDSAGYPHISYCLSSNDIIGSSIVYAYHDGSRWHFKNMGTCGFILIPHTSLALDTTGHPHIGYRSGAYSRRYAHYDGSKWQTAAIGSPPPFFGLRSWFQTDKSKTSSEDVAVWDAVAFLLPTVSLVLDPADQPHISYYDEASQDLKYAYYDSSAIVTEVELPQSATDGTIMSAALGWTIASLWIAVSIASLMGLIFVTLGLMGSIEVKKRHWALATLLSLGVTYLITNLCYRSDRHIILVELELAVIWCMFGTITVLGDKTPRYSLRNLEPLLSPMTPFVRSIVSLLKPSLSVIISILKVVGLVALKLVSLLFKILLIFFGGGDLFYTPQIPQYSSGGGMTASPYSSGGGMTASQLKTSVSDSELELAAHSLAAPVSSDPPDFLTDGSAANLDLSALSKLLSIPADRLDLVDLSVSPYLLPPGPPDESGASLDLPAPDECLSADELPSIWDFAEIGSPRLLVGEQILVPVSLKDIEAWSGSLKAPLGTFIPWATVAVSRGDLFLVMGETKGIEISTLWLVSRTPKIIDTGGGSRAIWGGYTPQGDALLQVLPLKDFFGSDPPRKGLPKEGWIFGRANVPTELESVLCILRIESQMGYTEPGRHAYLFRWDQDQWQDTHIAGQIGPDGLFAEFVVQPHSIYAAVVLDNLKVELLDADLWALIEEYNKDVSRALANRDIRYLSATTTPAGLAQASQYIEAMVSSGGDEIPGCLLAHSLASRPSQSTEQVVVDIAETWEYDLENGQIFQCCNRCIYTLVLADGEWRVESCEILYPETGQPPQTDRLGEGLG